MRYLKQSTSVDLPIGPFLDSGDGVTPETSLTLTQPDIRLKKNAGAWAQKAAAQSLTHEENGWYEVTLDATDTDTLGQLMLAVHESGALPVWHEFMVLPANVYDSLIAGSDLLDTGAAESVAGAVGSVTGNLGGNVAGNVNGNISGSVGSVLGAVGSVTGNVGGNVVGSVASVTGDVGITQGGADKVWVSAARTLTSFGTLVADVATAVWGAVTRTLSAFAFTVDTNANATETAIKVTTDKLADTLEDDGGTYRFTENALEEAPSASGTIYGESGSITFTYTVYDTDLTTPLVGVAVYVSADIAGTQRSQTKVTDDLGRVQFDLVSSTVYFWRSRDDRTFSNPDTEIVS